MSDNAADILADLSLAARQALRECARKPNPTCQYPMGGHGRGPILSACRSLVRKGLLWGTYSAHYGLTAKGLPVGMEALSRYRAELEAQKMGAGHE